MTLFVFHGLILLGGVETCGLEENLSIDAKKISYTRPLGKIQVIVHAKYFGGNGMLANDLVDDLVEYGNNLVPSLMGYTYLTPV